MSLPPYKHRRNPCLQTEDEPIIPSLAGAPLITHRCVLEKRRTSDQRVARNLPAVEFEYVYVPPTHTPPGSRANLISGEELIGEQIKSKSPTGASGDRLMTVQETGENNACSNNRRRTKDEDADDAKSTCSSVRSRVSRRSLASHCSHSSQKTEKSDRSKRSGKCCETESVSSTLAAVLKTHSQESCFQKFGRISNGLDDDDLRPRRR